MPHVVGDEGLVLFNKNCWLSYVLILPMLALVVVVITLSVVWKDMNLLWFMIWYSESVGLALVYRFGRLFPLFMPTIPLELPWLWKWLPGVVLLAPILSIFRLVYGVPQLGLVAVMLMLLYLYSTLIALIVLSSKLEWWAGMISKKRVKQEIKKILVFLLFFFIFPLSVLITL